MNNLRSKLVTIAAIGSAAVGGGAIANAATSSTTSTSTGATQARPAFTGPAHGTPAHENAEKAVTGAAAAKAQAAAVKSVGSGTAGAVTSDMTGTGFETTVTTPDGSQVEVHLDSSYNVMRGPGSHGGSPAAGYGGSPTHRVTGAGTVAGPRHATSPLRKRAGRRG